MDDHSHKKSYVRPVKATWWLKNSTYIKYMVRELTAVFSFWCAIELLGFAIAIALMGPEAQNWISRFLQNPAVIAINIVSLPAVLFHTYTWYNILPIGVRVFTSRDQANTNMIPRKPITLTFWGITCIASALIIWALL